MLNRRRKNQIMDPKRVVTYNKFLSTLDQIPIAIPDLSGNVTPPPGLTSDDDMKQEIDKLISRIQETFSTNNYTVPTFTGQNSTDDAYINRADPNYYNDVIDHKYFLFYTPTRQSGPPPLMPAFIPSFMPSFMPSKPMSPIGTPSKSKTDPPTNSTEIRETINIETEVNTIADILELIDKYPLDPAIKYNINMKALHDIKEPLKEINCMIGMKDIKNNIVDQILYFVQDLHKNKNNSGDFLHTVIYGPPGTGKTEMAKLMGKIYSNIGILSKGTFKKVTRSDLIAGYLGQTAIKTRDVIKEAIGGVLFIDEAYALGNPEKKDSFAKECIDTLCEALSDNKDNLMVIIAGYEAELRESFFNFNPGLDSRFTWRFKTDEYTGEDLYNIFLKKVSDIDWKIEENSKITSEWFKKNKEYFPFYGRDVEAILAKTKIAHSRRVFCKPDDDKKRLTLKDLDAGFAVYLRNDDVKNRKNEAEMKKLLYNTLYS
jgi:SpoVK/Ycf46/Vps4 family AAA+-type ATPase